jgi:hypothetical protein
VPDTRTFVGRELNPEYIFGLFMPSESLSMERVRDNLDVNSSPTYPADTASGPS